MARYTEFEKRTIGLLEELAANNNRDWFKVNKPRYEDDVLDVALRFIFNARSSRRSRRRSPSMRCLCKATGVRF